LLGAFIATTVVVTLKTAGFDNWFDDPGSFFYEFYLDGSDAVVTVLFVIIAGVVIGLLGSIIGLRRFLRV
jgi:cell division protein FtsX